VTKIKLSKVKVSSITFDSQGLFGLSSGAYLLSEKSSLFFRLPASHFTPNTCLFWDWIISMIDCLALNPTLTTRMGKGPCQANKNSSLGLFLWVEMKGSYIFLFSTVCCIIFFLLLRYLYFNLWSLWIC
jgi:hypothetical protein